MIARVLGNVEVTIGNDPGTAAAIEKMGGTHIKATHGEVVVDKKNKVFTTPCYMLDATIVQIYQGVTNVINEIMLNV
jgi:enhancing lycopene biosynthesis protein 2